MTRPMPTGTLARLRAEMPQLGGMVRRGGIPVRAVLMGGGIVAACLLAGGLWLTGGRYVVVDDAYVRAARLMVTTDVSGLVAVVEAKEGSRVRRGDVLFRLDPRQYEIALRNARAQLAQTKLAVNAIKADYRRVSSAIAAQQAQVDLARATKARYESLVAKRAVSEAVYDQARFTLLSAEKTLDALRQEAGVQLARLGGNPDVAVEQHPQYLQSRAVVDEAQRQLDHTVVRAPFNGIVTKVEALQPGTFLVAPTAALTNMGAVALVGTDEVWVEANIKETDLTHLKTGNAAEVTIDSYPGRTWKGRVSSISPASGAEFSILPAQNASGNWVKITQRVPVKIDLITDDEDPVLRSGMSVVARIDTGHRRLLADLLPSGLRP